MNTWPTEDEIVAVLRDGTHRQIAELMVKTCCTEPRLRKRYAEDRRKLTQAELMK